MASSLAILVTAGVYGHGLLIRVATRAVRQVRGIKTVDERLREVGTAARARLSPSFRESNVPYPPTRVVLVAFKAEKRIDLYAARGDGDTELRFIKAYQVLAVSGTLGPKLQEGDQQVPEGQYSVEALNPNSLFHLSMRLSYPSEFDREMARRDNRRALGGDIMIHGGASSVGCVAIGNTAIEDLFVLVADVGLERIDVVISPVDFRETDLPTQLNFAAWGDMLYSRLRTLVTALPRRR